MCLHYLVKLIARVLSPYITYFSIGYRLWTFGIKFSLTTIFNSQQLFPSCLLTWGIMQERVYNKGKIANVEEFRHVWERLDQRIIDGAVKEWRKRLRACAAAEGGQFEHELWLLVQQCCCNCALWLCRLIVWLLITFDVTADSLTLLVTCSRCEAL